MGILVSSLFLLSLSLRTHYHYGLARRMHTILRRGPYSCCAVLSTSEHCGGSPTMSTLLQSLSHCAFPMGHQGQALLWEKNNEWE